MIKQGSLDSQCPEKGKQQRACTLMANNQSETDGGRDHEFSRSHLFLSPFYHYDIEMVSNQFILVHIFK